jgi:peptidyl-tRNA hydrolase
MKMYILIKDDVPNGFAVLAAAHASLACYLKFNPPPAACGFPTGDCTSLSGGIDPVFREWLNGKFYKVVCRVNNSEFENAKSVEDAIVLTESALDNKEVAIAFKPREEWPKMFKFLKLWK